jgi:hypothetical protein
MQEETLKCILSHANYPVQIIINSIHLLNTWMMKYGENYEALEFKRQLTFVLTPLINTMEIINLSYQMMEKTTHGWDYFYLVAQNDLVDALETKKMKSVVHQFWLGKFEGADFTKMVNEIVMLKDWRGLRLFDSGWVKDFLSIETWVFSLQ